MGTLTPTPTSLTLGHPALEGGEVNRPTVGEQPWIEAQGGVAEPEARPQSRAVTGHNLVGGSVTFTMSPTEKSRARSG